MIGVSSAALTAAAALGASRPVAAAPAPGGRSIERLAIWRFHLGHAAEVEKDFGFGRNQRTFAKGGAATADAAMADFDDRGWAEIQVPHDWAVALPFAPPKLPQTKDREDAGAAHGYKAIGRDYPANSIGWYRTQIAVTAADQGRRVWLEFDGVFRDALIFVNGYIVARNQSGYAPFRVEIDDFLNYDGKPNVIAVRADASLGEGWFYEGAGIYRHVDLVRADPLHIPQWGTVVRSTVGPDGAQLAVATEVFNSGNGPVSGTLRQSVSAAGREILALPPLTFLLAAGERTTLSQESVLRTPMLWSIETPHLYRLQSQVDAGGRTVDATDTQFGIRTIKFDAERGFFLNGKPTKLLGTCNHHDHAGVGTGIPDALHRWRVEQTQAMGANAWRSAHNPPASALLDACDALGMLMIVEQRINSTDDDAAAQLDRIVRRDCNHPSVILWSLGNEEPHQSSARGGRINAEMQAHVRRLDPTRPTTFAMDNNWDTGVGRVVDVLGFNYRIDKMEAYHGRHPDQPIYGSETGSTVATRGEYANDEAKHFLRAYDTEHPWWSSTAEEWWTIVADRPYLAGGFVWTGFDYRGEPTPYAAFPSVLSQFGILDTCGFPKDDYYYYRAWWRPDRPLVHLLPHWTWPGREGQAIEVWAHGNAEEIELKLNGRPLGRKSMPRNRHLEWRVPYAPGRIEAIGFNNGRIVAQDVRETAGPARAVQLSADRRTARADGSDVITLNAAVVDARGRPVPNADNLLRFAASGGTIIGVGNGSPVSLEPDVASQRRAFNGLVQAILRVGKMPGPIAASVASDGLSGSIVRLAALPVTGDRR
ncbi:MAG: glycoside hydrolase family 2 protein [Sphingomonas sp.]|nr:glycoside hydrolase family 2 protein [Sphingomonas sp.]